MKVTALAFACFTLAQAASAGIVFVDLGTGAPPAQLGGRPVSAFDPAPQAAISDGTVVTSIPGSPSSSPLGLSAFLTKATVPATWPNWSHGYRGSVFVLEGSNSMSFFLSSGELGFYFYVQPANAGSFSVTAISDNGTSSGPKSVSGNRGARGFGFYGTEGSRIHSVTVQADETSGGFAVGEFGVISGQAGCVVMDIAVGDTVEDAWSDDCASSHRSDSFAKYYAFTLAEGGGVQIALRTNIADAFLFLLAGRGPFGQVLASNDDDGTSLNSLITTELPPGEYTIEATTLSFQAVGPFTLDLRRAGSCVPDATTLCVHHPAGNPRFEARVRFATVQGGGFSGDAEVIPLRDLGVNDGGLFWFFGRDNPEMLLKIIDGCQLNDHFWVFYSAGTNAGLVTTVVDTLTGLTRTYSNPDLTAAPPVQDTTAFPCE